MLKKILLGTALIFTTLQIFAQKNITLGKPYGVIDAETKEYFTKNGEILTLKLTAKKNVIHLQKLDAKTLSFKSVKMYDDFPKDTQIEKISEFNNRYFVFYSLWDGKNENLYVREIDFAKGTFIDKGKKLISVNEKLTGTLGVSGFRYSVSDKFDFFFSYNNTGLLIQYRYKPELKDDSKNYDQIGMHVFDKDLNETWSKKVKMPYTEKKMDNLDYSVDSQGNVYIVTRVYKDNSTNTKKKGDENANFHLEILKVAAETGTITASQVEVKDKFPHTIWLYESVKGYMICAGYYNSGDKSGFFSSSENLAADGLILFKLKQDGSIFDMNTYEIPLSILTQNASKKEVRKTAKSEERGEAALENMALRHIEIQPDGSIILIGEQRYYRVKTSTSTANGSSSTRTYVMYYNESILVSKISPAGALLWMNKLPKNQTSGRGWRNLDFTYLAGENSHSFFFLDNVKNMELKPTDEPEIHADGAGGYLTRYTIQDASGEVSKSSILDTRNVKGMEVFQFAPYRMMSVAPNTIVFEAYKKKKEDILVKVVLE